MAKPRISTSGLWMASIAAVTAVAFAPALSLYFLTDDFNLIETARNTPIRALFEMETFGYYRPILFLSFALEHALWQTWAPGFHATNVALHLINTVLVCMLAQRMLKENSAWIFAGIYFGLTATHAGSILWICGRTDLLCATFYLLSILTYLIALERTNPYLRIGSLCAFVFALLTKEMAGSLPLICMACGAFFYRSKTECSAMCAAGKALATSWPYFAALTVYFGARYLLFGHLPSNPMHGDWMLRPILENLARYTVHLISPVDLEGIKPFFRAHPTWLLIGAVFVLGVFLLILRKVMHNRAFMLAALWTGISLLPVLRVFGSWYLYIPSVGVALAFGHVFNTAMCRTRTPGLRKAIAVAIAIPILLGLIQIQRDTIIASDMSSAVVSDLIHQVPANHRAIVLNLPSEYPGVPVFGWPGNLQVAMRLFNHPIAVHVISSVRYATRNDSIDVALRTDKTQIDIHLPGHQNFFRIHDDVHVLIGRMRPQIGDTYESPWATVRINGLNAQGHPSSIAATLKSSVLTDDNTHLLFYARGALKTVE